MCSTMDMLAGSAMDTINEEDRGAPDEPPMSARAPTGENLDWSKEGIALWLQEFVMDERKKRLETPQLAAKDLKVSLGHALWFVSS